MLLRIVCLLGVLLWAAIALRSSEVLAAPRKHIVCYVGTWATYRQSVGKFDVTNIDPFLCTHLLYAFFGVHEENGTLRVIDPYLDLEENGGRGNIRQFNGLKLLNPTLKTIAAIGGWNEGSKKFSIIAADPLKRVNFIRSVVQFVQQHGFDGIDLDWEYPAQRHNLMKNDDQHNFVVLVRELKEGLNPFGYLLTAAVGAPKFSASQSYRIAEIAKYLDLINLMTYDLHGPWENVTGINAPLYPGSSDRTERDQQLNVVACINYWLDSGAPREKLMIGVPFYGRSFTLANPGSHEPGAESIGPGIAGQYSLQPGVIGYNELCERFKDGEPWTVAWEDQQKAPYAYMDRQWIGFETPRSIALKAKYVMKHDLGGVMLWSLESDDFRGICGSTKYPLLRRINRVLFGSSGTNSSITPVPAKD